MSSIRNSAHWMPDIRKLCQGFKTTRLNPKNLIYRENEFPAIDEYCDIMVDAVKHEIYFNHPNASDCLLDHHKITAIHIVGVLKNQPFVKESTFLTTDDTYFDVLPNEHYCVLLLKAILLGWHKSCGRTVSIIMPNKYNDCLLLLLRKYRMSRSPKTDDIMFAYALSNIIYFIDTHFVADITN